MKIGNRALFAFKLGIYTSFSRVGISTLSLSTKEISFQYGVETDDCRDLTA